MNELIPFKKSITFNTKISDITDISVKHDYKVLDNIIDGDFIVEGTYKMTEASVLNEDFFYKIPFSIALSNDLRTETVDLNIEDFKYEISNFDTLLLDITLNLSAEEELESVIDEVIKESEEDNMDRIEEEKTLENANNEIIEPEEVVKEEIKDIRNESSDEFVTYKVYIVKENDTLETICEKYNVDEAILKKYNNIDIKEGEKVIIPCSNND